jgi:hypothetical protein
MKKELPKIAFGHIEDEAERNLLHAQLTEAAERLLAVFPQSVVVDFFTNHKGSTRGRERFPYCRVDTALILCRDCIESIKIGGLTKKEIQGEYERASLFIFRAIVWVEIGFEGLDNLAQSKASRNWTNGVGSWPNDNEKRIERLKTIGRKDYNETLREFVEFRNSMGVTEDIFTEYGVEDLLDQFRN